MSRKNKDVFSEIIVGLFMTIVVALLAYFTIVISGVDLVLGREQTFVKFAFPDVGGLKERDNVVYRGMKVGAVEEIKLCPSNILVTVKVDRGVVLREGAYGRVDSSSLLGGNFFCLEEGAGRQVALESKVFRGEPAKDWMRDLGQIASRINELTADGAIKSIITNIDATAKNLNAVVARIERGEGTVGKLLGKDETIFNDVKTAVAEAKTALVDAKAAVVDAKRMFANAASISDRLEKGEGTIGKLLSTNDTVYVDLRRTFANAASISERLEKGEGTVGKLLSKDDALWKDLKSSVASIREATDRLKNKDGLLARLTDDKTLADNARKLVDNLTAVSDNLAKGKGTLGKLTNESEMYDEVNALIKDVRQIVDNYRDTTPITTFGSLATGAL